MPDLYELRVEGDLEMRYRKAFELCVAVNQTILEAAANPAERHLQEVRKTTQEIADLEIHGPRDEMPLADFMRESISQIHQAASVPSAFFHPSTEASLVLEQLARSHLASLYDPDAPLRGCHMLQTFDRCARAAHAFYTDNLRDPLTFPRLHFRVMDANQINSAFPGRTIAFNATVKYADNGRADKSTAVTLKVRAQKVDCDCLVALPYIIMHELVCHWPEMARQASPRPNPALIPDPFNVDGKRMDTDPFSEGWMDRFVGQALERREINGGDPSAWSRMQAEIKIADEIHTNRTTVRSGQSFADAPRIVIGEQAAQWVVWLYDGERRSREHTQRDLARLSCELNVADWDFTQRRTGCMRVDEVCRAYMKAGRKLSALEPADQTVIKELLTFRDSRDITPLLEALLRS